MSLIIYDNNLALLEDRFAKLCFNMLTTVRAYYFGHSSDSVIKEYCTDGSRTCTATSERCLCNVGTCLHSLSRSWIRAPSRSDRILGDKRCSTAGSSFSCQASRFYIIKTVSLVSLSYLSAIDDVSVFVYVISCMRHNRSGAADLLVCETKPGD